MRAAGLSLIQGSSKCLVIKVHLPSDLDTFFFLHSCSSRWHFHPFHVYCHSADKGSLKTVHDVFSISWQIFFPSLTLLAVFSISTQHQWSCLSVCCRLCCRSCPIPAGTALGLALLEMAASPEGAILGEGDVDVLQVTGGLP